MAWPLIAKIAMMAMSQKKKGGGASPKESAHARIGETQDRLSKWRQADPLASALPGATATAPPITEEFASGRLRQGAARRALKDKQPAEVPSMETTDDLKAQPKGLAGEPLANKPAEPPPTEKLPVKNKADTPVY